MSAPGVSRVLTVTTFCTLPACFETLAVHIVQFRTEDDSETSSDSENTIQKLADSETAGRVSRFRNYSVFGWSGVL